MVIRNAVRLLCISLLTALTASFCAGQEPGTAPAANGSSPDAPAVPAKPKVMQELPPNPPKVTCKGDELTILADNSTLSSVLSAVHTCTGVQIDIPDGANSSRTFDQLGPGPARQVLTALLNGTDFNYVIESSVADPQKVEAVLLIPHTPDKAATTLADRGVVPTPARRAWALTQKNGRAVFNGSNEDASSNADGSSDAPASDENPAAPSDNSGANATPAQASPTADAATLAPLGPASTSPSADKATEDKITSMQQLFEQRKQMNENQSTPPPKPQ